MRRVLFVVLSGLLALVFALALAQDMRREWAHHQRQFRNSLQGDERRAAPRGIQQTIVKRLDRVDRCTTCHVAIEQPKLALAEEPFTAHPGAYLTWHPTEQFGCTVCHGGQGLATEVKAAHGDVPHWEEPLLRGAFVQASCLQCHGNVSGISGYAPLLAKGRALFEAKGCYGCHAVHDVGQSVSVDLTPVGAKSYQLMEADFENMPPPHDRIHWMQTKLHDPRVLNPGVRTEQLPKGEEEVFPSVMPNFGLTEEENLALTTYLLALNDADPPGSYTIPPEPTPVATYASDVERGRAVFQRVGCTACHGVEGRGGRHSWNSALGEEVPPLLHVKAYYGNDVEALKRLIRNGRQPVPRAAPDRPQPGLYMPAWKDKVTESELDALVAYLFSLADALPHPAAVPPAAPENPPPADDIPG